MQPDSGRLRVVDPIDGREDLTAEEEVASLVDGEDLPELVEDRGPPSPGRYIRDQRQRRGMSLEQLSVATKIPRTSLRLLEDDRFEELPGPVFVKGFLRCAARSLGVDPDAVMELLYEKERAALQARRRESKVGPAEGPEPMVRRVQPRSRSAKAVRGVGAVKPVRGGSAGRGSPSGRSARPSPPPRHSDAPGLHRFAEMLPSATTLLWVVVVAVLAMIVMAAFNLLGTPGSPPAA